MASLRGRFEELLDRMTLSTAKTSGVEWAEFKTKLLDDLDVMEARFKVIEENLRTHKHPLTLPDKKA